ncbi:hypothetical protein SAMN04488115_107296 [Bosea lathyri]|uniref:Arc-like DNA binding domain-containing protein n=1 Tax=Bosea lathyri TaxID=1036778 RepID=A0A1H6BJZ5_9HYPH|nr:hypothetical protein SAMN04488115_107296 [Bosea lathyri]
MSREDSHFRLRLAPDIKAWISASAARNLRSMTAEVSFALRERMAATGETLQGEAPAAALNQTALAGGSIYQRS